MNRVKGTVRKDPKERSEHLNSGILSRQTSLYICSFIIYEWACWAKICILEIIMKYMLGL